MTEGSMKPSDFPVGSRIILQLLDERGTSMSLALRIIFAITAIGSLFERAPWRETEPLMMAAGLALPVFMAALAATGFAPGGSRKVCYFTGFAATLLIAVKAVYILSA